MAEESCGNCPNFGMCEGPTKPFKISKGGRINIHRHAKGHTLRVLLGAVALHMVQDTTDGGFGGLHGEPEWVRAGQDMWIGPMDRHGLIALEDSEIWCDFGIGATVKDTEMRYK